jgi:hypothetical protein
MKRIGVLGGMSAAEAAVRLAMEEPKLSASAAR